MVLPQSDSLPGPYACVIIQAQSSQDCSWIAASDLGDPAHQGPLGRVVGGPHAEVYSYLGLQLHDQVQKITVSRKVYCPKLDVIGLEMQLQQHSRHRDAYAWSEWGHV